MCNCCLVVLDCWLHQEEHFRVDFERLQVLDVSFDFEYQSAEADVLRYGLAVVQLVSKDLAVHDILKLVKQRILAFDDRVVVVRLVVHACRSRNAYFVELSFRHRVNIWVYVERNLELVDFCFAFDSGNYTTALRCLHCKDQHTRADPDNETSWVDESSNDAARSDSRQSQIRDTYFCQSTCHL